MAVTEAELLGAEVISVESFRRSKYE